jgi:transitional endoplasmic reticulum ATPase
MRNEDLLSTLETLKTALHLSPENTPLRSLYVDKLIEAGITEEALGQLKILVQSQPDNAKYRTQLAKIYYDRLEISKGIVLIEGFFKHGNASDETIALYVRLLIAEKDYKTAAEAYYELQKRQPPVRIESIENDLGKHLIRPGSTTESLPAIIEDDEPSEVEDLAQIEKPRIKFADVGGMAGVKEEIAFKIIRPIQHQKLFATYGKKAGGGILLYGPPGCGKTFIARATAGETNSSFVSVGINEILDMWLGQSEKNLHSVFDYARRHKPAVLFFDEIDAIGASRIDMKTSAGRHIINQLLIELDGDKYSNEGVLVLGATNAPWHMDHAFLRSGRFDRVIFVPPPDQNARIAILRLILRDKPTAEINYEDLAKKTEGFSGSDLAGMVDIAIEALLKDVLLSNEEKPLTNKYLFKALSSVKPSTRDWFSTAKNYAIYSNEGGLFDEVAKYLGL